VKGRRIRSQDRILLLVLLAAVPGLLLGVAWALASETPAPRWTIVGLAAAFAVAVAFTVRRRLTAPLQSLANLLEALREGDYSLRGRHADPADAFGEVMVEVNMLGRMLHGQRLRALEAGMLLDKIVAEIDLAVFAFDAGRHLRLVNRAGERLLGLDSASLLGRAAAEFELDTLLDRPSGEIVTRVFPGAAGRWEVRHRSFREAGLSHELLVISDLSRALRDEERQASQRLVRVIGHELNNSLTPIKSMAGTLRDLIARDPPPDDWREDAATGLDVIGDRAESLGRFMAGYARLARLPAPRLQAVQIAALVERAVLLEGRDKVEISGGPAREIQADPDQLEQVLINLLKNALEAAGPRGGVRVRWRSQPDWLEVEIEDDGPGLARTENLWVPFFTTKPGGTGIGLVLSRDIIENHGGAIALRNREDGRGCVAWLRLPVGG
jgi:two-component system, NtrC family, nitrogen regulation sensor histidine kinase NtrY